MKKANELTVTQAGAVYIGKLATKELGIYGYKWAAIQVARFYIFMRIFKLNPPHDTQNDYAFPLHEKSGGKQAMTGNCRKFAEKLDFGDTESLDLHFSFVSRNEDGVLLKIIRPGFVDEEATPESEEVIDKDAQAKVASWIMVNGCTEISCGGFEGKFDGTKCPLMGGTCGRRDHRERYAAENWLTSNGYSLDQETPLGTVSKPAEKQLGIFDLPGRKAGSAPRTRPLPDGLPEWLHGPLSRGEHVQVSVRMPDKKATTGWAIGAYSKFMPRFKKFEVAVIIGDGESSTVLLCSPGSIFQSPGSLMSPDRCYKIAGKLGIGLSALQIEAINSGGVPPEDHGLPDDMFE